MISARQPRRPWNCELEKLKEEPSMKRALFASLLMSMTLLAASCARSSNSNEPLTPPPAPPANKPVSVTVTWVAASGGNPERITIDVDDGVTISRRNGDTVKWRVKYNGPGPERAANITLDDFTNTQNANDKDPFGNGSGADNRFTFDPEGNGSEKTKDTLPASKSGTFKYRITVALPDGPVVTVDPVLIVD
jgi:hypothetical protein